MNPLIQLESTARDEDTEPQLTDIIDAIRNEYDKDTAKDKHHEAATAWFRAACYHWIRVMAGENDCRSLAIVAVVLEKQGWDMIPAILASLLPDTTIDDMRDTSDADLQNCYVDGYIDGLDHAMPAADTLANAMWHIDSISQNSGDDATANAQTLMALLATAAGQADTAREAAWQANRIDPDHPYAAWLTNPSR
ncbi:hypothetical protein [Bifidobacterium vansinderenii]|uniref:Uncharacterized protein n=1 Tax=Bifidobacterium vansinderenii TaxID=1984871 RepID=A0A229VYD2_9BIFI|nr:hypothetical protein [Bifidobacterium vansinderenii]OXN00625.1 hypothetical protein Tam10B_1148 [Bifidobacterium vansinderenii]